MAYETRSLVRRAPLVVLGLGLATATGLCVAPAGMNSVSAAPGDEPLSEDAEPEEEVLLEFHFSPVEDLQIAVWIEDAGGNHVADVMVTQATGRLGIGNRPGMRDFVSSWRAPYGPRESVLPIWAHRRGKTYPKIIFHDPNTSNHTSLGFHEISSSPETYFCRPLTPTEDEAIVDTMTCPSPATFQSDKGEFFDGQTSVYPPRNDLTSFEDDDAEAPKTYADLNDLDAITRATPSDGPYMVAERFKRSELAEGPLTAWIEVSLERDENSQWDFDREDDHWVDPKLPAYGRGYYGQPAVVYKVDFDPNEEEFNTVLEYAGYGEWDGSSGDMYPPDGGISGAGGSGADRLQIYERFGETLRFGVYSHGWELPGTGTGGGETGGDSGGDSGGGCSDILLPPVENLRLEATSFDEVWAHFTIPEDLPAGAELSTIRAYYKTPETDELDPTMSTEAGGIPPVCRFGEDYECLDAQPGDEVSVAIDRLFGNYTYTVGIVYEDVCTNTSEVAFADVTTPVQPFQTIDGACFIATAAWGAGWTEELRSLRWFRDAYLVENSFGWDLVRTYYAYGPTLAKMIRKVPPARAAARLMLRPVAGFVGQLAQAQAQQDEATR